MRKALTNVMREKIAMVCHAANKAWCESIGDSSQKPWSEAEDWQRASARLGVDFAWSELEAGRPLTGVAQWEAWAQAKRTAGWTWGPVKDSDAKTHPCLVDKYSELPMEEQMKDHLFNGIVTVFFVTTPEAE